MAGPSRHLAWLGAGMLALAGVAAPGAMVTARAVSTPSPSTAATTWTVITSPNPSAESNLAAVSCVTSSDCWAAGAEEASGGIELPFTEHDAGSGWTVVSGPVVGGSLGGVSCPGATACLAVGTQGSTSRWGAPLTERYSGSSWVVVPTPATSSANGQLTAVDCVTASDCWAVGGQVTSSNGTLHAPLVEHYGGSTWTISGPASGASVDGVLDGIACVSADDCWAAGFQVVAGSQTGLIEQFSGGGWNVVASSGVAPLDGIACLTTSSCWAVGQGAIERGGGGPWALAASPAGLLTAVTCAPTLGECWAVGVGSDADALVEQYAAGTWAQSAISTPHPAGFTAADLEGVACTGAGGCVAVGSTSETVSGTVTGQTLVAQLQAAPGSPAASGTPTPTPGSSASAGATATPGPSAAASPSPPASGQPAGASPSTGSGFPWVVVVAVVVVVLLAGGAGVLAVRRRLTPR